MKGTGRQRFVRPQLATLVDAPPTGDDWVFEVKYDGYRIEALVRDGTARLLTRRGKDWTRRFLPVAQRLARLPVASATLDGELVALDRSGRSIFNLLQQSLDAGNHQRLTFFAFDLLQLDDRDLRGLPLDERRRVLQRMLRRAGAIRSGQVRLGQRLRGDGAALLRAACRRGLEGIIAKQRGAPYHSRRTRTWLKVKCGHRQELVVIGFTPPKGSRVGIGSLLLGAHERGALHYAGRVGSGMDGGTLRLLHRRLARMTRTSSPLASVPSGVPPATHWVQPCMVVEVSFTEWTRDGRLRHPVFQGLREDKSAKDVHRERAR
jgi:bifunctional non-homologous end joining protein LigD